MAHKTYGGWFLKETVYVKIKIANELWVYGHKGKEEEKQYHIIFLGWYERNHGTKLFAINILWVSFQFAWLR